MGFQHMLMANILNRSRYFDVQTGTVTLSGTSQTATIAAIDTSKAVLEFTYDSTVPNKNADECLVLGQVNNSTQIEFLRYNSNAQHNIRWWIWEAKPHVPMTVARYQEQVGNSASLPQNQTITAVDLAKSFCLATYRCDDGGFVGDDTVVRAKLTTTTNLQCDMDRTQTNALPVEIQVVEHTDWAVQTGDKTSNAASDSAALSPTIALADSYISASGEFDLAELFGRYIFNIWQNANNTINFTRITGTGQWIITWYIADTKGDFSTQWTNQVIASGNTSQTATVSSTDTDKTFLKLGTPIISYGNVGNNANDADWNCVKLEFGGTPATQNTISRTSNGAVVTNTKTARHEILT